MYSLNDWKKSELVFDSERKNRVYLAIGKRRYIYEDGKYVGWYKP